MKELKADHVAIRKDDCYTFSYTSGTTGPPKGAMISHGNMVAGIASFYENKDSGYNSDDRYLCYLPLPHLLERLCSAVIFVCGGLCVYPPPNSASPVGIN
jgi:long-chain acyl-CoA synthetase